MSCGFLHSPSCVCAYIREPALHVPLVGPASSHAPSSKSSKLIGAALSVYMEAWPPFFFFHQMIRQAKLKFLNLAPL